MTEQYRRDTIAAAQARAADHHQRAQCVPQVYAAYEQRQAAFWSSLARQWAGIEAEPPRVYDEFKFGARH